MSIMITIKRISNRHELPNCETICQFDKTFHLGSGFIYFLAFEKTEVVGIATIRSYWGTWYLRACYVHPNHRGKGIQDKLIKARLSYLKKKGEPEARVSVSPNNTYSVSNVVKNGFIPTGKKRIFDGVEYHVYKKLLKA